MIMAAMRFISQYWYNASDFKILPVGLKAINRGVFRYRITMKRIHLSLFLIILTIFAALTSCIEDGFSSSSADQPTFSVDTLQMGVIFTEQPSTTHRFTVYNNAGKAISINHVSLSGDNAEFFRLNVDGLSGREFNNVEIRANDSIFVFVETTLPANDLTVPVEVTASLDFLTNGVTRSVTIAAIGRDVNRIESLVLDSDTRFVAGKPYQIIDSLVVSPGATLTIDPGAELLFHDGAMMVVRGTLKAVGEPGNEITFAGDRTGYVAADISFDIMSRQWVGMFFTNTSYDNELSYAHVCNTWQGVTVDGGFSSRPVELKMINTRLRNSGDMALEVYHANIKAYGCEIAEAANGAVYLHGGEHVFNHCTLSNYYLFTALGGAILQFGHINAESDDESGLPYTKAEITNTIIYGLGADLSHGDLTDTDIYLRRCLLKSAGTDDDNFIDCLWDTDPGFLTIREEYYFDYRLHDDSPAIGAADPSLTATEASFDRYGLSRGDAPDLGAYVHVPEE